MKTDSIIQDLYLILDDYNSIIYNSTDVISIHVEEIEYKHITEINNYLDKYTDMNIEDLSVDKSRIVIDIY